MGRATATEQNIQQYVVEKLTDGQTFKQIGIPVTPRNSGRAEVYDLTDEQPVTGIKAVECSIKCWYIW